MRKTWVRGGREKEGEGRSSCASHKRITFLFTAQKSTDHPSSLLLPAPAPYIHQPTLPVSHAEPHSTPHRRCPLPALTFPTHSFQFAPDLRAVEVQHVDDSKSQDVLSTPAILQTS